MTLARTAVRLCVVSALTDATVAGNRVYDSQIVDFDPEVYSGDGKPAITILSDDDEGTQLSDQNGGPPFRRYIDIVVEMSIFQTLSLAGEIDPQTSQPYPDGTYQILTPDTDARCEASLDFLEHQVMRRLSHDDDPICVLFRSFNRITKSECHRQTQDGTAVKIASRVLTLQCDTNDDQLPGYSAPGGPPVVGFDRLPEPLRSVALTFPQGTDGYRICAGIAIALDPLVLPLFSGMDFTIDGAPGVDNGHLDEIHAKIDRPA